MKLEVITSLGLEHLSARVLFQLGFPKIIPSMGKQRV